MIQKLISNFSLDIACPMIEVWLLNWNSRIQLPTLMLRGLRVVDILTNSLYIKDSFSECYSCNLQYTIQEGLLLSHDLVIQEEEHPGNGVLVSLIY